MADDDSERDDEGAPPDAGRGGVRGRLARFLKSKEGQLVVLGAALIGLFLLIRRFGAQGASQIGTALDGLPHVDPTGATSPGGLPIGGPAFPTGLGGLPIGGPAFPTGLGGDDGSGGGIFSPPPSPISGIGSAGDAFHPLPPEPIGSAGDAFHPLPPEPIGHMGLAPSSASVPAHPATPGVGAPGAVAAAAAALAPAPTPAGLQLGTVVHPGDLNPHHAAAYIPHPIAPHPAAPTHPAVRAVQAAAQAAVLRVRAGRGVQY